MLTITLLKLYERDLGNLRAEIEQYTTEEGLWLISGEITNSAGNLTLHLIGNLRHFIGAVLGESGYVRDRSAEFSVRGVLKSELVSLISETEAVVLSTLRNLNDASLARDYPIEVFGHPMSTEYFLVHLATHLNYHLGQINYHRRLLAS